MSKRALKPDDIKLTGRINMPVEAELETEFLQALAGSNFSNKSEFGRMIMREGLRQAKARGISIRC
ncbi:MAG: hypothetical protein JXR25_11885 [Pontiellaceae bacterium]|nr:hypothetical protein [Pontiellaceae bacterium]